MTPNEETRRDGVASEVALHGKVKEIMVAERVPYIDALETAWYDPENAKLVEAYRAVGDDDEGPCDGGPMLSVDAGIEVDKRVRVYMSAHETNPEAALYAVLAADAALRAAWDADLMVGTN